MYEFLLQAVVNTPVVVTLYDRNYNPTRDYLFSQNNGYIVYNTPFTTNDIARIIIYDDILAIYLK